MKLSSATKVKDIAISDAGARQILEEAGVDYCCGGERPLNDACLHANISAEEILKRLEENRKQAGPEEADWNTRRLDELTRHIRETHHRYTREAIARLKVLFSKVSQKHGAKHPELNEMEGVFAGLGLELAMHMQKEEMILFPYIESLERAAESGETLEPPFFQSVRNPIQSMMRDHDDAGAALASLRKASGNYAVPEDTCPSYRELYRSLEVFEKDLHTHVHLENNILFPRAAELEGSLA